jgi:hypothetical protein
MYTQIYGMHATTTMVDTGIRLIERSPEIWRLRLKKTASREKSGLRDA